MRLVLLILAASAALPARETGAEMTRAAEAFLASLSAEERRLAALPFGSDDRLDWKFVPAERRGLALGAMSERQRALARGLLQSALSAEGARQAQGIQDLEGVLAELEQGRGPIRDPLRYHLSVFGTPGPRGAWAWRFEGHHLSIQLTLLDGQVVGLTPHFMGANPGKVAKGPHAGREVLGDEDALGRALAATLTPEQAKVATLPGKVPSDILSGSLREARALEPRGIPLSRLSTEQRVLFWLAVERFARRYRGELAEPALAELRATPPEQLTFAWCGGLRAGEPHYYRIQGPALLIELDNTQNGANHVHTVWRDLRRDFGGDALRRHLVEAHGER